MLIGLKEHQSVESKTEEYIDRNNKNRLDIYTKSGSDENNLGLNDF